MTISRDRVLLPRLKNRAGNRDAKSKRPVYRVQDLVPRSRWAEGFPVWALEPCLATTHRAGAMARHRCW